MYLLDTNVISELRKNRPHGAVLAWFKAVPTDQLFLSAVSLGEIQSGIEITREQDPEKAATLEKWADQLMETQQVLPMDARVFRIWARLMHRTSNTLQDDAMIAATALAHQLIMVTRNVKDFARFRTALLNPFEASQAEGR